MSTHLFSVMLGHMVGEHSAEAALQVRCRHMLKHHKPLFRSLIYSKHHWQGVSNQLSVNRVVNVVLLNF